MQVAIDETDRRRAIQAAYNVEHGIEPTTIVKGIHDLNQRLRAVAESTIVYTSEREGGRPFDESDRVKVEALVARMEAEMRAAAKELEFERAAALRDEIQQIRLRVLEQDVSVIVARAAERAGAAAPGARGLTVPPTGRAAGAARRRPPSRPVMEVTSVTVLPADEEPAATLDGEPGEPGSTRARSPTGCPASATSTRTTRGWQARWLDRPTWDRTVTPEHPQADRTAARTPGSLPGLTRLDGPRRPVRGRFRCLRAPLRLCPRHVGAGGCDVVTTIAP